MTSPLLLVVAGDPSGDLHASNLIKAIKRRDSTAKVAAVGGPLCREIADEFIEDLASRGVTGFWEPALKIGFILRLAWRLKRFLAERRPGALICVDYYGFNRLILPYAKAFTIPAFYFVSPQVWASRPGRASVLKRFVQKMLVIFPFEEKLYRELGVPVEFVGHPLLDLIAPPARRAPGSNVIGLLPGSRASEVSRHLPVFYDAFRLLREKRPSLRGLLFAATSLSDEAYGSLPEGITLVRERDYAQRAQVDLAICSSGTATLENALLGVPMIVVYKMSWPTYAVARSLVKVKNIAMANILAGKTIVPELIQGAATSERVVTEATAILDHPESAATIASELLAVRLSLGKTGAVDRAAAIILAHKSAETAR
ncbi:MAG: lipid-A-disaccharide synthase [Elusimicrobiota bacterium]